MNLYLIKQTINNGYDTYDSAIVAAHTEAFAKLIHPNTCKILCSEGGDEWCENPEDVIVEYLGKAAEGVEYGVVLASFNAG